MRSEKAGLLFLLMIICHDIIAQNNKTVYLEAGGSGLVGTLNFENRIKFNNKGNRFGIHLGMGASPKFTRNEATAKLMNMKGIAPLFLAGVNTFFDPEYSKSSGNNIEFGINALFAGKNSIAEKFGDYKGKSRIIPSLNVGFRKQHVDEGGLMWRISYTPYFLDGKIRQWGGISIGYQF